MVPYSSPTSRATNVSHASQSNPVASRSSLPPSAPPKDSKSSPPGFIRSPSAAAASAATSASISNAAPAATDGSSTWSLALSRKFHIAGEEPMPVRRKGLV